MGQCDRIGTVETVDIGKEPFNSANTSVVMKGSHVTANVAGTDSQCVCARMCVCVGVCVF